MSLSSFLINEFNIDLSTLKDFAMFDFNGLHSSSSLNEFDDSFASAYAFVITEELDGHDFSTVYEVIIKLLFLNRVGYVRKEDWSSGPNKILVALLE